MYNNRRFSLILDAKFNFQKYSRSTIDSLNTKYDYGSLMHYGSRAFSKNGLPTIQVSPPLGTPGVCHIIVNNYIVTSRFLSWSMNIYRASFIIPWNHQNLNKHQWKPAGHTRRIGRFHEKKVQTQTQLLTWTKFLLRYISGNSKKNDRRQ